MGPIVTRFGSLVDAALASGPVDAAARRAHTDDVVVLAYHGIDDAASFSAHLDHIASHYVPVSCSELVAAAHAGNSLGRRRVLVTFDDGHRSVLDVAAPLLHERGIPAAVFIITSLLDTDTPFWWDEVRVLVAAGATAAGLSHQPDAAVRELKRCPDRERRRLIEALRSAADVAAPRTAQLRAAELVDLENAGIEVGNHTNTHPCLDQCDEVDIAAEITAADDAIEAALGHPPVAFAYPNGNYDERVAGVLRESSHDVAFLFDHRVGAWPPSDPLRISRVRVDSSTPIRRFRTIVSGLHPAVHRLRNGT